MTARSSSVTWGQLLVVISLCGGLLVSVSGAAWAIHASQPHKGSVSLREFERMDDRLKRIEDKLDRIISQR